MDDDDEFVPEWLRIIERVKSMPPDMVIKCGDEEHKVHKLIMTSTSSFFDKACNGAFQEAQTSVVHLPEDNPESVAAMVAYLYSGNYGDVMSDLWYSTFEKGKWFCKAKFHLDGEALEGYTLWVDLPITGDFKREVPFHIAMYKLADKYGLEGLQEKAEREIARHIDDDGLEWDPNTMEALLTKLTKVVGQGGGMNSIAEKLASVLVRPSEEHLSQQKVLDAVRGWAELNYQIMLIQREA